MFVWTINDAIGVALFFLCVIASAIFFCAQALRQRWCKHRQFFETRACDAVCSRCGKNLGFIGTVRAQRAAAQAAAKGEHGNG